MCPMQWFTPRSGFPQSCATVRATRAAVTSGAPIPGPEGEEQLEDVKDNERQSPSRVEAAPSLDLGGRDRLYF